MKRNHHLRIKFAGLFLAAAALWLPARADALSIQDILVMSSQGVPDNVIITVINSAEDLPAMDKADYEALKKGGVANPVIETIAQRRKVLEKSQSGVSAQPNDNPQPTGLPDIPAAQSGAHTAPATPAPAPETAPGASTIPETAPGASTMPGTAPGASTIAETAPGASTIPAPEMITPVGNSDEPSQIVQGTVLAPVESSNAAIIFRKFFEEAYETYTVEAEVARRYDELQNATAEERASDAELPTVAGYDREITQGRPVRALESCLAMASERHPHPDTALGAALNRCIGRALAALGAKSMGAAYLDMALQSRAVVQDYSDTFGQFLTLAHEAGYSSTAPLKFKAHDSEIRDHVRSAYNYFIAYSLVYGPNPDSALAYHILSTIKKDDDEFVRARVLQATLDVRSPHFRFKTAAEHLNQALDKLEKQKGDDAFVLKNTAWLSLARIASENHAYEAADAFYRRVDVNSHHLRDAIIEDAWTLLFAKNYGQALALTHALRAPMFAKSWMPDMLIVEAGAYLGLCRYDMANNAVETLRSTYVADAAALRAYMAETPARDYYVQVIRHAENPQNSKLPPRIYYRVISDLTFKMLHKTLKQLGDERQNLSRMVSGEFTSWPYLQKVYDDEIAVRQQAMALVLSRIFESGLNELHALDISASQIAIEIKLAERRREAECLKIVASGGQCKKTKADTRAVNIAKGDSDAFWTFDGEFWRDELRAYVAPLPSLCE